MPSTSAQRAPRHSDSAPASADRLAALRAEIDRLDAQLLHALEQRIALAREIGANKAPVEGQPTLGFRPDREAAVVGGLLARAEPSMHALVQGVWREVMSAGLAAQGPMTVAVWRGPQRRVGVDAARRRFGARLERRAAVPHAERGVVNAVRQRAAVAGDARDRAAATASDALPGIEKKIDGDPRFTVVFDQAPYIQQSIDSLAEEGLLGLGFAVIVILVFLLSWRSTLVTAISIPTSVLLAATKTAAAPPGRAR